MKDVEKAGYVFGMLLVALVIGFLSAVLITFTVGLFFPFPFTLLNIAKIWLGVTVLDLLVGNLLRNR
tara:strand:+ start:98 stop:298 length:201 start_codon:yes stop_codon:yes gene_type:complete